MIKVWRPQAIVRIQNVPTKGQRDVRRASSNIGEDCCCFQNGTGFIEFLTSNRKRCDMVFPATMSWGRLLWSNSHENVGAKQAPLALILLRDDTVNLLTRGHLWKVERSTSASSVPMIETNICFDLWLLCTWLDYHYLQKEWVSQLIDLIKDRVRLWYRVSRDETPF